MACSGRNRLQHHFSLLSNADTPDRKSIEGEFTESLCSFSTQILLDTALQDSEQCHRFVKLEAVTMFHRPSRPSFGPLEGTRRGISIDSCGRTFVEHHRDGAAELCLNIEHRLGSQQQHVSIDVIPELHSLFIDAIEMAEGEDLKAAGIGQDRAFPAHHLVQSSQFSNDLGAGPHCEVIGIGKDDLRTQCQQLIGADPLHRALGSNGHESGGADRSAWSREGRRSRAIP